MCDCVCVRVVVRDREKESRDRQISYLVSNYYIETILASFSEEDTWFLDAIELKDGGAKTREGING